MEIRHIKQKDIDFAKWDNCIASSFNGIIYAYSWYLDIVCPGWDALVCGDYESVMPLTHNRKYSFNYLFQPFFCQQLGVFSSHKLDSLLVDSFIRAIPLKYKFVEINLNKYNCINDLNGYNLKLNNTYELDLISSYENIFRKYKKNNIRNIRKAIHHKISIMKGLTPEEIFGIVRISSIFPGIKDRHYDVLYQLITEAIRYKSGYLYGAYDENKTLCAVGFFIYSNNKACFILSVSSDDGKKKRAMFLLIDEFIKDFSGQNIILDFEGSNIPGIARFYEGFGANPFNYPTIKANKLPFPVSLIKN
jgi:hypothetical protein